jgi:hypothetical protein
MPIENDKETKGAWIIHHSRKIAMDVSAPAEFSVIDEAGKAAELLIRLGESNESTLSAAEVNAVAQSVNLNPRRELSHFLDLLKNRRLIDISNSNNEVRVLGVSTRSVLSHAASIFDDAQPTNKEIAAIDLGEFTSAAPKPLGEVAEYLGDTYKMRNSDTQDFLRRSTEIGFVDQEGDDPASTLIFNGNLFKHDSVHKTLRVLSSLDSTEQSQLSEITEKLHSAGCITAAQCETLLGYSLFEKLKAVGVLEINTVSNEQGDYAFVTLPGAFHKYVNPMIDDSFDLAKALVAALSYGIHHRSPSQGRIISVDWILGALIQGREIGPATAIGNDYRVLEQNRVVKLIPWNNDLYKMKLLKKEIGELALQVMRRGDANVVSIRTPPAAPMSGYTGPERTREQVRRKQSAPSKRHTFDILTSLRGGGRI